MELHEIWVEGHVSASRLDELGLVDPLIERTQQRTRLRAALTDQAALFGVLHRLRDLGLQVLAVVPLPAGSAAPAPAEPAQRARLSVRVTGRVGPWLGATIGGRRTNVGARDTVVEFDLADGMTVYSVLDRLQGLALEVRELHVDVLG